MLLFCPGGRGLSRVPRGMGVPGLLSTQVPSEAKAGGSRRPLPTFFPPTSSQPEDGENWLVFLRFPLGFRLWKSQAFTQFLPQQVQWRPCPSIPLCILPFWNKLQAALLGVRISGATEPAGCVPLASWTRQHTIAPSVPCGVTCSM